MVKDGMYKGSYRTNKLDDVSNVLLAYGKYNNYSGGEFRNLPIEEQVKYSLQDSKLVMDLSKYRDFEALDSMLAIAEITGLDFERICQTRLTTWWGAIFDKMVDSAQCPSYRQIEYLDSPKGAKIIPPKKGMYHDVVVVDAQSLYPSVAIKYNLSFDTINCQCCYDNPQAKISKIIPKEFTAECKYIINPTTDWICQKRNGAFPSKLKGFKEERLKQKQQGNNAKAHALKILINGGYGVFGHRHFRYFDGRAAELITATGRYTLAQMQQVAENEYGFEVIYGDTDSLFLNNTAGKDVKGFTQRFRQNCGISLEVKNKYDKLLLSAGEKHYIGVEKGKIDNVGYEGEKSDRCEYFHTVYDQLLDDMLIKEIDPLPNVKKAFRDLQSGKIDSKLLTIAQRVNQEPGDYVASARVGRIAKVLNANKGDLVHFYNANEKHTGKSWTLDPAEIDYSKYKELLWNIVSEILQIAGYSVADLAQEFGVKIKVKNHSRSIKKKSVLENYSYNIADNKTGSIGGGK
jgi:DNA polymerase I